jgi:hypothetical protein
MEIYDRKKEALKGSSTLQRFVDAVEVTKRKKQLPSSRNLRKLKPDSVLVGRVSEVVPEDEVSIEFDLPSGERFVESFEIEKLRAAKADFLGARIHYYTYQAGGWSTSRFELR